MAHHKYKPLPELPPEKMRAFWSRIDADMSGCWEWIGTRNRSGYGIQMLQQGTVRMRTRVHRIMMKLMTGEDPGDRFVTHSCDNPICVNPIHLSLGNYTTNHGEMMMRGRYANGHMSREKAICKSGLTCEIVNEIRAQISMGARNKELAALFNVTTSTISDIRCGRTWRNTHEGQYHP